MTRELCLSIDLDALELYAGLYGLEAHEAGIDDRARRLIPGVAAQRFGELCNRLGIEGTLFVVGRDLDEGRDDGTLARLAADGHELGSHSWSHDYALSRWPAEALDADLARAEEAISSCCGERPVGFRAPGYTLSAGLIDRLRSRGYRYDSSLLASPPYYAAKAAVIGGLSVLGRQSRSILGPVGQLFSSRQPHRLDGGLAELPVAVLPGLRVPFIGTLIVAAPASVSKGMSRLLDRDETVVLELHGVDLIDGSDGIPAALTSRQRDLGIPASTKIARIEGVVRRLLRDRAGVCLRNAGEIAR